MNLFTHNCTNTHTLYVHTVIEIPCLVTICAANFSFAQLAKRKRLGRSKPATNSQAQAPQHTVWNVTTISKSYRTAFYRNK